LDSEGYAPSVIYGYVGSISGMVLLWMGKGERLQCSEIDLPQCHFVQLKCHLECPRIEPGALLW